MTIGQRVYLVIVDAYSKWVECLHMANGTTTQALISKLKQVFSTFGIPNVLVSDNDIKINSAEFNKFCSYNGINYKTSPIYHPCSNGQAENSVRTCKKIMKCILKDNVTHRVIYDELLGYLSIYRNTVHCSTGQTPARLMFGRELRTRLDLILPKERNLTFSLKELNVGKIRQFNIADHVWVRWYSARKEHWIRGKVLQKVGNRMFKIFVYDYNVHCIRHIDQMLKCNSAMDQNDTLSVLDGLSKESQDHPSPSTVSTPSLSEPLLDEGSVEARTNDDDKEEWMDCGEMVDAESSDDLLAPAPPSEATHSNLGEGSSQEAQPLTRQLRPRTKVDYKKYF